jgi:hypothetical protein
VSIDVAEQRGNPKARKWWRFVLVLLLSPLGLYAALPLLAARPAVHRWIAARLRSATGWDVPLATLRVGYDLSATLQPLSVSVPGQPPFLTAARASLSLRLSALRRGGALQIRIEAPHLETSRLPVAAENKDAELVPSVGSRFAAGLHGAHIEVVDGFVHFATGTRSAAIGPLTLVADSDIAAEGLHLLGKSSLGPDGGMLEWSAVIGASIAASHASLSAEVPVVGDLLRLWLDVEAPPPLREMAASLRLDLRGTSAGRIALTLDSSLRVPGSDVPLPVSGSGEIDPAESSIVARLTGSALKLQSADFRRAASGLQLTVQLAARRQRVGSAPIDFDLSLPAGEILWDRVYVDLREHPLGLKGRLESGETKLRLTRAALSVHGIGTARGDGSYDFAKRQARWRAAVDIPGLGALYAIAVRDPFKEDYPLLTRVEVDGHASAVIEQILGPQGERHVTGVVDLAGVGMNASAPLLRLRGLDLHLPLDLDEGLAGEGRPQAGRVHVTSLGVGNVEIENVEIPLTIETNQIAIAEPVRIALFGGSLDITRLAATALMSAAPHASVGLALWGLDLDPLARAAGLPPLTGSVTGEIPRLTLGEGRIQSAGEIRIHVFDGEARLRDLRADELLSPVPALRFDFDFQDISLAQLTKTFEIGGISGIVAGSVHDLVIVNGQPVRFDAHLETVARSGVPQRISVTAIRQISILGGSGGDPLSQGLLGFFQEYRYAKMGVRCSLENDRFLLRGVEEIDGADYLVVGTTLPPRVNVISHNRVIAFSELLRRLSRVAAVDGQDR